MEDNLFKIVPQPHAESLVKIGCHLEPSVKFLMVMSPLTEKGSQGVGSQKRGSGVPSSHFHPLVPVLEGPNYRILASYYSLEKNSEMFLWWVGGWW